MVVCSSSLEVTLGGTRGLTEGSRVLPEARLVFRGQIYVVQKLREEELVSTWNGPEPSHPYLRHRSLGGSLSLFRMRNFLTWLMRFGMMHSSIKTDRSNERECSWQRRRTRMNRTNGRSPRR